MVGRREMAGGSIRLNAAVERHQPGLPRYVVVPARLVAPWGLVGTSIVEAEVGGHELGRRSIKKWDDERWFIELPQAFCERAGIETGDTVEVGLKPASDDLPAELEAVLRSDADARSCWEGFTRSRQRMVREHVAEAKTAATRTRRARRALIGPR